MGEWGKDHLEMKKFIDWVTQKEVGITVDINGDAERRKDAKNIPAVGGEFGFLILVGGGREENPSEEGYQ